MTDLKNNNLVFYVSAAVMISLILIGLVAPEIFEKATKAAFNFCATYLAWWYMLAMNLFVIFPLYLACSKYAKLKLGPPDCEPDFSTLTWFAMLFGASMGVGLVFYGVGEPIFHLVNPPYGAEPGTAEAAEDAMRASFFHWGLHPWAGYCLIGLCLAYAQFRKGDPVLMSSLLLPILGPNGNHSLIGRIVDVMAIFATVGGVATSIGLAVMQVNSGLMYAFGIPQTTVVQLIILAVISFLYIWTAVTGVNKGIKILGNLNLVLAALLTAALLLMGPTITILEGLVTGIGSYLSNLVSTSLDVAPYGGDYKTWLGSWTLFYWAWWISWAPFVGAFIARISRGRTVREFVVGGFLVPVLGSFCWIAIHGGTALEMQLSGVADIATAITADISSGSFAMYEHLPMGGLMSALMAIVISTFLITSANASTYALTMYSSNGVLNPPKSRMALWGVLQSSFALVLMLTGGLGALQTASIAAAGPFSIIMVLATYCLWKRLQTDFPEGSEIR